MSVRVDLVLPTFLIVGAMKSGTTALHDWIGRHPDAMTTAAKELNFFSIPSLHPDGLVGYARHFAGSEDTLVRGESSPSYAMWPMRPDVPEQIAATLPGVRIVYCVREPISRMRSNYLHAVANGSERRPIDQALLEDPRYTLISSYATQLDRYLAVFDPDDLLVVCAEDLLALDRATIARVCEHIGLDPARMPAELPERVHVTADKVRVRRWAAELEKRPRVVDLTTAAPRAWQRLSRAPIPAQVGEMTGATRDQLVAQLRPEVERFVPWLPAGHDGWGLL